MRSCTPLWTASIFTSLPRNFYQTFLRTCYLWFGSRRADSFSISSRRFLQHLHRDHEMSSLVQSSLSYLCRSFGRSPVNIEHLSLGLPDWCWGYLNGHVSDTNKSSAWVSSGPAGWPTSSDELAWGQPIHIAELAIRCSNLLSKMSSSFVKRRLAPMPEKSESSFRTSKLAMMIEKRVRRCPECPRPRAAAVLPWLLSDSQAFDKSLVYSNKPLVFTWESTVWVWI